MIQGHEERGRISNGFQGLFLAVLGGVSAGILSALFLGLLERVNIIFQLNPYLVLGLPFAGMISYFAFRRFGQGVETGNSLILQVYHCSRASVPFRMVPMVLIGTLLTHLFGGSVGREGTAVQMAVGALVGGARRLGFSSERNQQLIACGISGGFGAVFGTPWAGAVYAVEMPVLGSFQWRNLPLCILSSLIGHWVCLACGVVHSSYPKIGSMDSDLLYLCLRLVIAGVVFGCCARIFLYAHREVGKFASRLGVSGLWRVLLFSGAVVLLGTLGGLGDYLGLGVSSLDPSTPSLLGSFSVGGVSYWSWLWKLVLTVLTLSAGFRGGEVTPLFFIGAAIGNATAMVCGWPVDYFAALGMAAVFFGACHCPFAGCIMGMELFGIDLAVPFFVACQISHRVCAGLSLYPEQRPKAFPLPPTTKS
jgi:H+/Cl- antiporter ClcA